MNKKELTLKEIQHELSQMLQAFADYCESNGLRYYLVGGTLLGAIRHHGFIPWDDDIDVGMPRRDYEKLLQIVKDKPIAPHLKVVTEKEGDFLAPFAEIINQNIVIERPDIIYTHNEKRVRNLFIDIIPQDGWPKNPLGARLLFTSMEILRDVLTASKAKLFQGTTRARAILKTPKVLAARLIGSRRIIGIMNRIAKSRSYDDSKYVGAVVYGIYGVGERCLRKTTVAFEQATFEGKKYPIPGSWHEYLCGIYGKDYMSLPPESKRTTHHIKAHYAKEQKELTRKEIQESLLRLLKHFDRFCRVHDLRYSLSGGSLLGAVRHKGFIPWDDDIDVSMPRPDYERFCRMMRGKSFDHGNIFLKDDKDASWPLPFAKLLDRRIKVSFTYKQDDEDDFLWMDIFPVDGMPEQKRVKAHFQKMDFLRMMLHMSMAKPGQGTTRFRAMAKYAMQPFFLLFPTRFWKKIIIAQSRQYSFEECDHVGVSVSGIYGEGESVTKNPDLMEMDFEGNHFKGTVMWDEYLSGIYGDYMQLPPEEERVPHAMKAYKIKE